MTRGDTMDIDSTLSLHLMRCPISMVECLLNVLRDSEGLDLGMLRSKTFCVQSSEDD